MFQHPPAVEKIFRCRAVEDIVRYHITLFAENDRKTSEAEG